MWMVHFYLICVRTLAARRSHLTSLIRPASGHILLDSSLPLQYATKTAVYFHRWFCCWQYKTFGTRDYNRLKSKVTIINSKTPKSMFFRLKCMANEKQNLVSKHLKYNYLSMNFTSFWKVVTECMNHLNVKWRKRFEIERALLNFSVSLFWFQFKSFRLERAKETVCITKCLGHTSFPAIWVCKTEWSSRTYMHSFCPGADIYVWNFEMWIGWKVFNGNYANHQLRFWSVFPIVFFY